MRKKRFTRSELLMILGSESARAKTTMISDLRPPMSNRLERGWRLKYDLLIKIQITGIKSRNKRAMGFATAMGIMSPVLYLVI
jgi:hypothetical protein